MIAQTIKAVAPGPLKKLLPELKLAYIFGSHANGTATPESDVDLAFLSCLPIPSIQRFDIAQELSEHFNLNVDLVDLREAGAVLKTEIIMKGHLLVGTKLDADYFPCTCSGIIKIINTMLQILRRKSYKISDHE